MNIGMDSSFCYFLHCNTSIENLAYIQTNKGREKFPSVGGRGAKTYYLPKKI